MNTTEYRLTTINTVGTLAEVKIYYIDGVHLLYVFISTALLHVLGDEFRRTEYHAVEIRELRLALHLYQ